MGVCSSATKMWEKVTDAGQQQRFDIVFCQYESCCVRFGVCMDSKGRKNTAQNQQIMKLKVGGLSNLHCTPPMKNSEADMA